MTKASEKEYLVGFTVIVFLALLLTGFYFMWISKQDSVPVAYAKFDGLQISNDTYAIKTNIAVQAASEHGAWLTKNKSVIESVLKKTLTDADMEVVTSSNRLQVLQESLKESANNALKTTAIQHVFFTDFLLVMNDSQ